MAYPPTFEPHSRPRTTGRQAQARVQVKRLTPVDGYADAAGIALHMHRWPFTDGAGQDRFYTDPFTYCARCGHQKNRDHGCLYCGR